MKIIEKDALLPRLIFRLIGYSSPRASLSKHNYFNITFHSHVFKNLRYLYTLFSVFFRFHIFCVTFDNRFHRIIRARSIWPIILCYPFFFFFYFLKSSFFSKLLCYSVIQRNLKHLLWYYITFQMHLVFFSRS